MPLPDPVPGLVIRYAYLSQAEQQRGQREGIKERPCAVILVTTGEAGEPWVTVLPITHTPPADSALAVALPAAMKARLGLDAEPSWIILTEANRFVWPGPDLRPARGGDMTSVAYGLLPAKLFHEVRSKFLQIIRDRQAQLVPRAD